MNDAMTLEIGSGNDGQLRDWDGAHGQYWAEHAEVYDASVGGYQAALLEAVGAQPGERILDVGCGSGRVALDLVDGTPGTSAVGVDLSSAQLELARRHGHGLPVEFVQADAQVHDFGEASYDVVVSRTGTMFFGDAAAAFANLARATKPGGRLVILVWRGIGENEWLREIFGALRLDRGLPSPPPGAPGPFAQSDPDLVRPLLTKAGWSDPTFTPIDAQVVFPLDVERATTFLLGQMDFLLAGLDEAQLARATANLRALLTAHQTAHGVELGSGAWLVTARR
jgi:SAM-dependent methyltransferase